MNYACARLFTQSHTQVLRTKSFRASVCYLSFFAPLSFFLPPPTSSSTSPGSSNRDTQFSQLHARVAETAVERNFRSRKKPRANIAIKFAPCKNSRSPSGFPPLFPRPQAQPPSSALPPPRSVRSVRPRSGSARSTGRDCEIEGKEKENRCDPFAMGKRDRGRSRGGGGGHDMRQDMRERAG